MTDVTSLISKTSKMIVGDLTILGVELFESTPTIDNADTFTVDLEAAGIKKLLRVDGYTHSTDNSVIVSEAPTTSVTTGTLTVTVGGSTSDKNRYFEIVGRGL